MGEEGRHMQCIINYFSSPPPPPLIVMLTQLEEKQQECSYLYWSDLESRRFGDVTIELIQKKDTVGEYIHREFKISHTEVRPLIIRLRNAL